MELTESLLASIIKQSQQMGANDARQLASFVVNELHTRTIAANKNLEEAKFQEAAIRAMRAGVGSAQLQVLLNEATINEVDYVNHSRLLGVSLQTK